ncbi:hypothetical protein SDRG_16305 [Saprolegnia diclina VS20]|uniref:Uncharacterized protein n=1 Tax=Saprolegnia diclina (strain VS20) TaxID=1156394 RepID=T0PUE8_SAPDV|nr:hypothetical protein SDRG_16305 [Saprolegnia diclina VS20]EQC25856.1 hypothetical protein SDRG_16305 [Saprolegnia diclina VS20]|eukprot:XP_008620731.1 hypothetical protein SDRG_16305 [Saprolegnia diclina VS20]
MDRVWHVALLASMSAVTLFALQQKREKRRTAAAPVRATAKAAPPSVHHMELSIAGSFSHNGLYTQALAIYSRLLTASLAETPRRRAHISHLYDLRSCVYEALQQFECVIADTTAALAYDPSSSDLYLRRGIAYAHLHRYTLALCDVLSALHHGRSPEDLRDMEEMLRALEKEAIFYEARDALQNRQAARCLPDDYKVQAYFDIFHGRDVDDAFATLLHRVSLDRHTSDGVACLHAALEHRRRGHFLEAHDQLVRARTLLPPTHALYVVADLEHASYLHLCHCYDDAATVLQHCTSRLPTSLWIQAHRFHNDIVRRDRTGSRLRLAAVDTTSPTLLYLQGLYHATLSGDSVRAVASWTAAITRSPEYVAPYVALSQHYLKSATFAAHSVLHQCLAWYFLYVDTAPPALTWIYLGLGHFEAANGRDATACYEASLGVSPAFVPAYVALSETHRGTYEVAQAYLMQALVYTRSAAPGILLAHLRSEKGMWAHAVDACDHALQYAWSYPELCQVFAVRNLAAAKATRT